MTIFVDTSAFYAAVDDGDVHSQRAREILQSDADQVTTDHVIVETWRLIERRLGFSAADTFLQEAVEGNWQIAYVLPVDLRNALAIGRAFADQHFPLVDRTSFSVMERLDLTRVLAFDDDFVIYRYGRDRRRAFEVLR